MTVTTAIASFFLIWWVSLFAVLPWGVQSQHEGSGRALGTDPGAPQRFRLGRTLLMTTVVALAIYAVASAIYVQHWVTLEGLMGRFDYTKY